MRRRARSAPRDRPGLPESDHGRPAAGYRLPAETRVGAVRLQVADLDRSLPYYEQVIGLALLDRADGAALPGRRLRASRSSSCTSGPAWRRCRAGGG